ncbi:DUF423 domain-containing protein [Mariniflexile sp.]|uniref:DUF423 domain-containing protein n=1 Tax=Mariniflexile sp. TaxID=1979402 RepID=UPI00356B098E
MNKAILVTAAILGFTSIILGAFGAHLLKELISLESQQSFETGVRYQMYHAILLLFVGTSAHVRVQFKKQIFYVTLIGVLLFSGSIYCLSTNVLTSFDFKIIGLITPLGGLLLIASWIMLFVNFLKIKS